MGSLYTVSTIILIAFSQGCQKPSLQPQDLQPLLGNWPAFDGKLQAIDDPLQRDLLVLQLAVLSPRHAPALCKRTKSQNAQEKCRQVVGRPHLGTAR